MRFFDTALADIDLAVASGYPESKVFKLHERKAECLEAMGRPDEAAEAYRLVLGGGQIQHHFWRKLT